MEYSINGNSCVSSTHPVSNTLWKDLRLAALTDDVADARAVLAEIDHILGRSVFAVDGHAHLVERNDICRGVDLWV